MIGAWRTLVDPTETGYDRIAEEYWNDVSVRALLDELLRSLPPSGNSHLVCRGERSEGPPTVMVLQDVACLVFKPGGDVTPATSSGRLTLVCHLDHG